MITEKNCSNPECKEVNPQPLESFYRNKTNFRLREWKTKNKERVYEQNKRYRYSEKGQLARVEYYRKYLPIQRDRQLLKTYGITLEQKRAMLSSQGWKCANSGCAQVLRLDKQAHVDHDHKTKVVRGVLCNGCNRALGFINDSPKKALGLVAYLQKYQEGI